MGITRFIPHLMFVIGLAMLIAGSIMLGVGIHKSKKSSNDEDKPIPINYVTTPPSTSDIAQRVKDALDVEHMKAILRNYTRHPHQAGTDNNKLVAQMIHDNFVTAGLEGVHFVEYDVLLSYPDWDNPNHVTIKDKTGNVVFKTTGISPPGNDEQKDKYAGNQWVAFSKNGSVTASIVYAHYGEQQHFEYLLKQGVKLNGTIALMRYGDGFRGNKVQVAESFGCIGALLMSDPNDVAVEGWEDVFDKSVWLPSEGVQRGSILLVDGDPLTAGYPAKNYTYRTNNIDDLYEKQLLPTIPAVPISYSTGYQILSRMAGPAAPAEWQGGLNVTYKIGPGMVTDNTVSIDVRGQVETRTIRNVVGYIRGATEPDRYVIIGNHYDAWVYGSLDPNSGSSILAEVARAFGEAMKGADHWRPARTIMFVNWDAEEYGLFGSAEFAEEFTDILQQRAVIYLNMDCFKGNFTISAKSVPTVYDALFAAVKSVENPNASERKAGRATVYDTWYTFDKDSSYDHPFVQLPAANSDQAFFFNYLGVPFVDYTYQNRTRHQTYPLYHSMYETPFANEHLYDTDNFAIHRGIGEIWVELAIRFADDPIMPFNNTRLANLLHHDYVPELALEITNKVPLNDNTSPVFEQIKWFQDTTQKFLDSAKDFDAGKFDMNREAVNSRLMRIERCFIVPGGIGTKPGNRHILFSVSERNSYAGKVMASVYDALDQLLSSTTTEEITKYSKLLASQISIAQYSVWCAHNTLRDFI